MDSEISAIILKHTAWGDRGGLLKSKGYTLPETHGLIKISANDGELLKKYGITLESPDNQKENFVFIDPQQIPLDIAIRTNSFTNNSVVIGKGNSFSGRIVFNGDNGLFVTSRFGDMAKSRIDVHLGPSCAIFLGHGATSIASLWIIEGRERHAIIGDDLMASWGITARNYDSHSIFDVKSGSVINKPGNIHIGPHCWIGQDAKILNGANIGFGSIIGANALVTTGCPPCSAFAGVPAKVVRTGVSWSRSPSPPSTEIDRIRNELDGFSAHEQGNDRA